MTEREQPDEGDVDAIFESIVARWNTDDTADDRSDGGGSESGGADDDRPDGGQDRPARTQRTSDVRGALPPARKPQPRSQDVPWRVDPSNSVADALLGGDDDPGQAGDDDRFTPPTPAPLPPSSDRLFWGAVVGLVLGPLGLIWLVVARPSVGSWASFVVLALIVGGFACLVLRQPRERDDDPSNGARV